MCWKGDFFFLIVQSDVVHMHVDVKSSNANSN